MKRAIVAVLRGWCDELDHLVREQPHIVTLSFAAYIVFITSVLIIVAATS